MSRCFPYPPPGYKKNGINDVALIESIKKRQSEEEKARKQKKKDRKREKKEKDKSKENGESEKKKHRHKKEKRPKDEKEREAQRVRDDNNNKRKLETENLEKSNLTEEHGQPVGSQNSSDSTVNSDNKRHKPSSPLESVNNSGSIIRIRLPLQRHRDPEMSLPIKEQPVPALGRTGDTSQIQRLHETPFKQYREQIEQRQQHCSTSQNTTQEVKKSGLVKEGQNHSLKSSGVSQRPALVPVVLVKEKTHVLKHKVVNSSQRAATVPTPDKENHKNLLKPVDIPHRSTTVPQSGEEKKNSTLDGDVAPVVESLPSNSKSSSKRKQRSMSKFNDLFENWVPLPLQNDCLYDSGDEKWLFESKCNPCNGDEVCKADGGVESCGPTAATSLWPRAHFLPAADIFALPYEVPF